VQRLENEQDVADGDWANPFGDWGLNHFWAWGSATKTFSNAANQCHFVPCPENEQDVADGDWANPFGDWGLNRFWIWGSAVKTFSNVANQCHFVPCPENEHEANLFISSVTRLRLGRAQCPVVEASGRDFSRGDVSLDEQHFLVSRQGPEVVGNQDFELIARGPDGTHGGNDRVPSMLGVSE
jgi:hypothetical protein